MGRRVDLGASKDDPGVAPISGREQLRLRGAVDESAQRATAGWAAAGSLDIWQFRNTPRACADENILEKRERTTQGRRAATHR